jgi:hypothetical protein
MRIDDLTIRNATNGYILEYYCSETKVMIYNTLAELLGAIEKLLDSEDS